MATATTERSTKKTGLEAFLPSIPNTPPLAPVRTRAERQSTAPAPARRTRKRRTPAASQTMPVGETQETRRAKTIRMGQARMVNALRAVRLLGNLASRNYEWQEGEIERMEQVMLSAVKDTFSKFSKTQERIRLEDTFSLVNAGE